MDGVYMLLHCKSKRRVVLLMEASNMIRWSKGKPSYATQKRRLSFPFEECFFWHHQYPLALFRLFLFLLFSSSFLSIDQRPHIAIPFLIFTRRTQSFACNSSLGRVNFELNVNYLFPLFFSFSVSLLLGQCIGS